MYSGTDSGDIAVVQMKSLVFAGCIRVCGNGVRSIVYLESGGLIAGGGDGSITAFSGTGKVLNALNIFSFLFPFFASLLSHCAAS